MKRLIIVAVSVLVVAALALGAASSSSATQTGRWQLIKSKVSYGEFTVTATTAIVRSPKGIAVNFVGSGMAVWACSRNFSVSSWSRDFANGGFHALPYVRNKDSCNVTASVSGEGTARVQIYKARW